MKRYLILLVALAGCPKPYVPDPPFPPKPEATCEDVCTHWRSLECSQAEPSPNGEPCEVVCDAFSSYWDLPCMASVGVCDAIEDCE